ncbi:MAG: 2-oxoglutarate and iron-dependent oxygenase domain-containing protein [Hyphomicrobiales bacterium]|jgi:isopenicillin N synthase-like dioxygenase
MSIATVDTGNGPRAFFASGLEAKPTPFEAIPLIDFGPMLSDDPAERAMVGAAVRKACTEVGFFYAINHTVEKAVVDATFEAAHQFFALDDATKRTIGVEKSPDNCGYTPLLGENTDPTAKGDMHEAFDFSLELAADDPDLKRGLFGYSPNQWPQADVAPGFRDTLLAYQRDALGFGALIFRAFALALELPEDFFDDKITKPLAVTRVLHYPPQDGVIDEQQIGTGAHSDYECFTILCTDDKAALQVLNAAGEWIEAPPVEGAFIVNVGDMMERWTNDYFKSTIHRAINRSGKQRYSIPLFFGTNPDVEIAVLESCQSPSNPPRYEPIQAGAYVEQRINETFAHRQKDE